ncbi:MAG: DNA polymerase Y family protein [Lautropia sp.]|nr:DNA polymerase Y family protein [Lautropia sp.]
MLWACIALPQLALDTVLRQHEDPSQPVVLLGGPLQRRLLVAANAAAQALGLRVGQRLVEAQAISDVFTALPHDPADDLRQQRWLAAWAYRYTHRVSLDWPDALLLEVGASLQLMGGWQALEARLHVDLQQLGFVHRIAVAPSARAAHLLAWLRDGLCFFEPDTLLHALERVPVRRALLPGETGEALHRMGIRRLGALFDTPRDGLQRRFGDELLVHIDQLRGLQSEVLHFYTPPDHFVLRRELPWRVENHRSLMFPLRRMIDDLVVFLSDHDRGVQHLQLVLEHDGNERTDTVLTVRMLTAERDADLLFELTRTRLEQLRLSAPVVSMRLQANDLPPFVPALKDLFE